MTKQTKKLTDLHFFGDGIYESPRKLYMDFACHAVDELLPDEMCCCQRDQRDMVYRIVEMAVSVTCEAAGIPDDWTQEYRAAVAPLLTENNHV